MITFAITLPNVSGDASLYGGLDGNVNELFKRAMDQSAASILNRLRTTYLAEQDPLGQAWIPSKSGEARRRKGGTGTLFDSGRLFRSIQLSRLPDLSERAIDTDVPYAEKHNFGREGMVKREFMAITPEHEALAESIFQYRLEEIANAQN